MKNIKGFGFFCLFCLTVTVALINLCNFQRENTTCTWNPAGMVLHGTIRSKKLQVHNDNIDPAGSSKRSAGPGPVNFEDYDPIDPVPTSKTSIGHEPILHNTPLMPYIPKPSPPPN